MAQVEETFQGEGRPVRTRETIIRDGLARIYHPSRFTEDPYLNVQPFGVGFWLFLAFVFGVEVIDIIMGIAELFGWITVVIGVALHGFEMFLSLMVAIFEFLFFYFHGVPSNAKGQANVNTRIIIAAAVKFVPVIGDFIPADTIMQLRVRSSVNRAIKKAKETRANEEAEADAEAKQFVAEVNRSTPAVNDAKYNAVPLVA